VNVDREDGMKTVRTWLCLSMTAWLLLLCPPPNQARAADPASHAGLFGAEVGRALRQCGVPGAAVGVWTPEGAWYDAVGLADVASGRKARLSDRFAIRSITKSFTVTMILQLAGEGRLRLSDPISRYYPGVPNGRRVTLRNLANMTSGVFDYTADPGFIRAFIANPARKWTGPELIAFGLRHPANFQPGAEYEYSNTNTLLLGEVIKRVTQHSYEREVRERLLKPLGLKAVRWLTGTEIPIPAATGYEGFDAAGRPKPVAIHASSLGAAGALASNLFDLRDWGIALAEGKLVPPRLYRQRFDARPATNGPLYDRYGLGMGTLDGWWGHTGSGVGFQAAVFHHVERNRTIAILLNASNVDDVPARLFSRLVTILNTGKRPDGRICPG
jgi:D-alanyl-D-alanine carboxypeptidase